MLPYTWTTLKVYIYYMILNFEYQLKIRKKQTNKQI